MCIVFAEVELSNTQIFTGVCGIADNKPTRQLVIYQNKVYFSKKDVTQNIMCLPIPLQDGLVPKDHITLYDFSYEGKPAAVQAGYMNFYESVSTCFTPPLSRSAASVSSNSECDGDFLEVVQVGGYKCSLARTPAEVLKLDPAIFGKPVGLQAVLEANYSHNFAFLLCHFARGKRNTLDLHPIAYTHPVAAGGNLFIPTRHYHGAGKPNEKFVDDWDHVIYVLGANNAQIEESISKSPYISNRSSVTRPGRPFPQDSKAVLEHMLKQGDSFPMKAILSESNACKIAIKGKFDNIDFQPSILIVK